MITAYFESPLSLQRLRAPKSSVHIDSFAAFLHRRGYAQKTICDYLRAAAHFGRWADSVGVAVRGLDERAWVNFRNRHLPTCRCTKHSKGKFHEAGYGATLFITHLRELGVVPPAPPRQKLVPPLIASFGTWML